MITDGDLVLAESGAIMEYIIATYGGGRLAIPVGQPDYANYLYWFHFVNGTLQPALGRAMMLRRGGVAEDSPMMLAMLERMTLAIRMVEARLAQASYRRYLLYSGRYHDGLHTHDHALLFTVRTSRVS